jgi:hypothetical protein
MRHLIFVCLAVACAACGGSEPAPAASSTPTPAPAAAPAVDASGETWLATDFVGQEPSSFVVLAGNWTVREEDGQRMLRVDGTSWKPGTPPEHLGPKAVVLFPGDGPAFAERWAKGLQFPTGVVRDVPTFSDGELAVDFRLIGGESDQYASLMFAMTPDGNHYAYRYNTKDGDAALWRVVNGERERLHHGGIPVAVPLNSWSTLRLRIDGPVLTGWVGDTKALEYTLPAAVSGRIGLWSKADSVTDYRKLRHVAAK